MSSNGAGYGTSAELYVDAGWMGVLPLPRGAKYPPPTGYTGEQGAWPHAEQIEQWRARHADGNLCMRLPVTVIGIDIDLYKQPNARTELEQLLGGELPPTWCSTSRDDGSGIYLYTVPELGPDQRWKDAPAPGVELIQFRHRYVLAYPSVHPEGRPYSWFREGELSDRVPRPDEPTWLPWALARNIIAESRIAKKRDEAAEFDLTDGEPSRRVSELLQRGLIASGGEAGSRHDAVRGVVLALVRAAEQGESGVEFALQELRDAFVAAVRADRPGGSRHAQREFKDMVAGAQALAARTEAPTLVAVGAEPQENDHKLFRRWSTSELLAERHQFEWIARRFMIKPTFGMIAGEMKTLKTYFSISVNLAIASGKPLFDHFDVVGHELRRRGGSGPLHDPARTGGAIDGGEPGRCSDAPLLRDCCHFVRHVPADAPT